VVADTVRDLIEAGLRELDDAVVAMDLVVAGSMRGASDKGLARCFSDICHLDDDPESGLARAADVL
jgi:hypothetical protein